MPNVMVPVSTVLLVVGAIAPALLNQHQELAQVPTSTPTLPPGPTIPPLPSPTLPPGPTISPTPSPTMTPVPSPTISPGPVPSPTSSPSL